MTANRRVLFGIGAGVLGVGIVCVLLVLPSGEGPFGLQMVGCQRDSAGEGVGTFVLTNQSTRFIPTFAVSPPSLNPKPEEGEPMYWIERTTETGWRERPGFAGLSYSRVVVPRSSWRFQIALGPKDLPRRMRLAYILGRVEVRRRT